MSLYDSPPHEVSIYLPGPPSQDSGGGVVLTYSSTPDQANVPCSINTSASQTVQRWGQGGITCYSQIAFLTSTLSVELVRGTKYVAVDTGRVMIQDGLRFPQRAYGSVPPLTYVNVSEQLG